MQTRGSALDVSGRVDKASTSHAPWPHMPHAPWPQGPHGSTCPGCPIAPGPTHMLFSCTCPIWTHMPHGPMSHMLPWPTEATQRATVSFFSLKHGKKYGVMRKGSLTGFGTLQLKNSGFGSKSALHQLRPACSGCHSVLFRFRLWSTSFERRCFFSFLSLPRYYFLYCLQ